MADFVTDTHALIWYLEDDPQLGLLASQAFDECDNGEINIFVPTICPVEMIYLQEKGRIAADLKSRFDTEIASGNSGLVIADLTADVAVALQSISRIDVPDMPDRIIVPDRIIAATAVALGLSLISKDHKIQTSGVTTVW